ncbi:MAG: cytochrome c, partial [Candidatus Methylomirabilia bacterium]
ACHNRDPARDGPLGPAIKGASRALLEAKVLRGTYPSGYTPRRTTELMAPQPQLAESIDDLAAFLL